jgi:valyl-tRNA synthetase
VAIAVNPKDKRYKKLLKLGKKVILPILNKEIPIIADDFVDIEFGT